MTDQNLSGLTPSAMPSRSRRSALDPGLDPRCVIPAGGRRGRAHRVAVALRDEAGAATAEYAVILLAAVGFAGLLLVILRGDDVRGMLTDLVHRALTTAG
ncbi:DUF4244 domain-containing protein [Herbiconiux sp. P18]|uniref:DUF4244 domain-containing protein n=1 Tax=Herbiconiux liangxiaofengii TaxID=3342795 RepID=UPI0035B817DA